jgi:hypothetical protein
VRNVIRDVNLRIEREEEHEPKIDRGQDAEIDRGQGRGGGMGR